MANTYKLFYYKEFLTDNFCVVNPDDITLKNGLYWVTIDGKNKRVSTKTVTLNYLYDTSDVYKWLYFACGTEYVQMTLVDAQEKGYTVRDLDENHSLFYNENTKCLIIQDKTINPVTQVKEKKLRKFHHNLHIFFLDALGRVDRQFFSLLARLSGGRC
jgi:hypothetical protein